MYVISDSQIISFIICNSSSNRKFFSDDMLLWKWWTSAEPWLTEDGQKSAHAKFLYLMQVLLVLNLHAFLYDINHIS